MQPHVMLVGGMQHCEELFPRFQERLLAGGGQVVDWLRDCLVVWPLLSCSSSKTDCLLLLSWAHCVECVAACLIACRLTSCMPVHTLKTNCCSVWTEYPCQSS